MIISFGNFDTEKIWNGLRVKKLPIEIQNIGRRKLRMLNNAVDLMDLRIPPANRLEKLAGNLKDFYNIRINDQWRIIFKWDLGNAFEVEIIDYHSTNEHDKAQEYTPRRSASRRVPFAIQYYCLQTCKRCGYTTDPYF